MELACSSLLEKRASLKDQTGALSVFLVCNRLFSPPTDLIRIPESQAMRAIDYTWKQARSKGRSFAQELGAHLMGAFSLN